MQRILLSISTIALTLCIACGSESHSTATAAGSSTKGTATSSGTVQGHQLTAKSAVFASSTGNDNSTYLVLSSQDAYCANLEKGVTTPNHTSVVFGLNTVSSSATSVRPGVGTFPVVTSAQQGAGNQAVGAFNVSNSDCNNALSGDSTFTGGSVTLATVTDTRIAGNFNVVVGSEQITGTFDTVYCDGLENQLTSKSKPACQK